ncbi:uncharacterized protein LOC130657943 [Hydractinia symbiolongicarpus]|uniref:uncharacterized protein LOC130657943 n=1 Tax=Hydractinia symbiolongicarpus TaxID=13093 RepID=UPI00254C613C|nr:uncharacterized protein LOC130657943 [Hydractinia symbiolongicarpus]XP_057316925.1 uncharacterized protein LOC130657943 [Hydractinia symbiolongicarpus]
MVVSTNQTATCFYFIQNVFYQKRIMISKDNNNCPCTRVYKCAQLWVPFCNSDLLVGNGNVESEIYPNPKSEIYIFVTKSRIIVYLLKLNNKTADYLKASAI